jgi:hypothetical protein
MKKIGFLLFLFVFGITAPVAAAPVTVYSNDFDGNEVFLSGVDGGLTGVTTTEGVQGLSAVSFSGNLLRNDSALIAGASKALTTRLRLNNLPAHDSIDISFLLAFIDSWDSSNGSVAPDWFNVQVDGISILQITSANASGDVTYNGVQLGFAQYGWWDYYQDRAFDMATEPALTMAHNTPTLYIDFFASGVGWQGGMDESWGIDNLNVVVNTTGVPEPATILLLGLGVTGLAGIGRKLKR